MLTTQGYPTKIIYDEIELRQTMFNTNVSLTEMQLTEELLQDLQQRLAVDGKKLRTYGLPTPSKEINELKIHCLQQNAEKNHRIYRELLSKCPLNAEQQHVFDIVVHSAMTRVEHEDGNFFSQC